MGRVHLEGGSVLTGQPPGGGVLQCLRPGLVMGTDSDPLTHAYLGPPRSLLIGLTTGYSMAKAYSHHRRKEIHVGSQSLLGRVYI